MNNCKKCRHTKSLLNTNEGYCPDCGEYLKKYYYVLRCSCCLHKRESARTVIGAHNDIIPVSNFCPVCGEKEFYIEKYEKLNLVDINYAIEVKETFDITKCNISKTSVWVEIPDNTEDNRNNTETDLIAIPVNENHLLKIIQA